MDWPGMPDATVDIEADDQVLGQQNSVQATSLKRATRRVVIDPKSPSNVKVGKRAHRKERIESPTIKQTPLHDLIDATKDDDIGLAALEKNLDDWKNDINTHAPNDYKESGLHMLAVKGFYKMARCLIGHGANIRAEDSDKAQPLHLACKGANVELVKLLLREGAPIDHPDSDGYLPLHWASDYGCDAVIPQLLGPKAKFLNLKESISGQTPLNIACRHDQSNVVKVLLEYNADLHLTDNDGWTPLFTAILNYNYEILRILMEHPQKLLNGKVFDIPDHEGRTPLMQLCANASEEKGNYLRDKEFIDALLKLHPNANAQDAEKRTALHFAIESAVTVQDTSLSLTIIDHVANDMLLARDSDGHTAFDNLFDKEGPVKVLQPVLGSLIRRLNPPGTDIEDFNKDLLFWMIADERRHTLAKQILSKLPAAERVPENLRPSSWQVMEWIIYYRLQGTLVLYVLVRSSADDSDEYFKSDAKRGKDLLQTLGRPAVKLQPRDADKGKKGVSTTHQTDKESQDDGDQDLRDLDEILDLCFFIEPIKRVETLNLLEPDEAMSEALSEIRAAVLQSHESSIQSHKVCQFRSLEDIVYGPDNIESYTETVGRILGKMYRPQELSRSPVAEAISRDMTEKAEFTWVHLPSTNIDWMENITRKILKRENYGEDEDQGILSFFRDSWVQIPDQTSLSRFMRPRYVERQAPDDNMSDVDSNEEDNNEKDIHGSGSRTGAPSPTVPREAYRGSNDSATEQGSTSDRSSQAGSKFIGASALYMPFLEFSMYHRDEDRASSESIYAEGDSRTTGVRPLDETKILEDLKKRRALLSAYKASPFHGPSTLDEFYYHFTEDSNEEKNMRNRTQVVTKYLYPNGLEGQSFWPLLRVSQLWIWIIDDRWLISCTSSTMNHENDDLVTSVLKYLNNEVESGSCQRQPNSANDMSRAIADYCIYTYEKKRKDENSSDKHAGTEPGENTGNGERTTKQATIDGNKGVTSQQLAGRKQRSIRQVYSDHINEIGRRESNLFSLFSDRERQFKETGYRSFTMEELDRALGEGATQLHRIKDVRDELNILKTIAKYQLTVRSKMAGETRRREDLIAAYMLGDIIELDNNAKQMHDAFISTISLQESELANFQAQEAVKQGKTVMVFTVVTVWFLPLSFLTSLFALDVSSFLEAPPWALVIVFTVPLLFLAAAGVYMYHVERVTKQQRQSSADRTAARVPRISRPKDRSSTRELSTYLESIRKRRSREPQQDVENGSRQG
ncbi:hypothetical protein NW768_008002 [Fusarium equiseti]|uniref:Ankyrin repeat protein n=1 Tax=Fusarium equiseti TaxID=61235 RepID=A0ABQ8R5T6_FUSEQ|nr:hypothetical protein NW768_008002 [Fusarium equiseti]